MTKIKHKPTGFIIDDNNGFVTAPVSVLKQGNDWEEIKENTYEILSFQVQGGDIVYKPKDHEGLSDFQWFLHGGGEMYGPKIHSVKRLSDESIFTIGDKIITPDGCAIYIAEFIKDPTGEFGIFVRLTSKTINRQCTLRTLEQRKKVFTSDDGVDMFDGDLYWYVFKTCGSPWTMGTSLKLIDPIKVKSKSKYSVSEFVKRFASEENAKKFIQENTKKPVLTTQDKVELFDGDLYWYVVASTINSHKVSGPTKVRQHYNYANSRILRYSSKEIAEQSMWQDVKTLSYKDVVKEFGHSGELTDLAKSRV